MKSAQKIQALYERFATGFLAPLLQGGTIVLDRPIHPGCVGHFAETKSSDLETDDRIESGLAAQASLLVPGARPPFPERDAVILAMAAYDLLAATDPDLGKRARREVLGWCDALIAAVAPPATRGAALARHAILARLFEVRRQDVVVKNWAYTYRFFGRPVPKRVVSLPTIRRVKQQSSDRTLGELLAALDEQEPGSRRRLRALIARSPITELLHPEIAPDLRFGAASLAVLSDPMIRGGVVRALVAAGIARSAPSLGHALGALGAARPPPVLLYFALLLLYETHVTVALDRERVARTLDTDGPSAWFAAVLPAVLGSGGPLADSVQLDEDDRRRLGQRAESLGRAAGRDAVTAVMGLVAMAAPPSPSAAPASPVRAA